MPCHCERSTRIRHEPRSSGLKESNNRTHRKPRCLPAKAMEMKRAMIEKKWRLYSMDLERPVFTRRCVQLQARFTQNEKGKEEDPVLVPKREDTREETEKEMSKGKDPKVTAP